MLENHAVSTTGRRVKGEGGLQGQALLYRQRLQWGERNTRLAAGVSQLHSDIGGVHLLIVNQQLHISVKLVLIGQRNLGWEQTRGDTGRINDYFSGC